ncbi:hypothetical protein [Anaeromyxobacter paludicola]|uniref:hypothetical protein n=1 Tax=Anaeromyxobacter paludicola TaxID=2918171 RepID=UPI0020BD5108|nr:hypothetical protein [Anaeromyxobacter paludicola]
MTGGGLYTSRADIYCRHSAVGTTSGITGVSCDAAADLPLTGFCTEHETQLLHLASDPTNNGWPGNSIFPAAITCIWTDNTGTAVNTLTTSQAHICCIKHP